jgi:hypothetical protein
MEAEVARTLSAVAELRETLFGVSATDDDRTAAEWAATAAAVEVRL